MIATRRIGKQWPKSFRWPLQSASTSVVFFQGTRRAQSTPPLPVQSYFLSTTSAPLPFDDGAGQPGLSGVHDVGGLEAFLGQMIDLSDPELQNWEQETHALLVTLVKNGYFTADEVRTVTTIKLDKWDF